MSASRTLDLGELQDDLREAQRLSRDLGMAEVIRTRLEMAWNAVDVIRDRVRSLDG